MNEPTPGRSCPLRYRYGPLAIARAPTLECETLYVVGGLYGNPFALDAILRMASEEQGPVRLCFNGDFNWFNVDAQGFRAINESVLQHDFILGNVEAELPEPLDTPDCGCAYPENVGQGIVDRSNAIHTALKRTAQAHPDVLSRLLTHAQATPGAHPFFARYQVGNIRVAVVHGDADSLAGWRFDPAECQSSGSSGELWRIQAFEQAQVDVFASSHTCSAGFHIQPLQPGTPKAGLISNNGAAGMPSVPGALSGLITRVSSSPSPHGVHRYYGLKGGVVEQVQVDYEQEAWLKHFTALWPPGSAAHTSYYTRISQGLPL